MKLLYNRQIKNLYFVFCAVLELDGPNFREVGENFELECVATGYPLNVELTWNRNGRIERVESPNNVFEKVVTSTFFVLIDDCISGTEYTCTAMTTGGLFTDTFILRDERCTGK